MEEYDRIDASYYDYYSTGVPGDEAFYAAEALKAGSPVLELGTGTGRIAIPIAEKGVQVTGLDLSPSMLAVFRKKIQGLDPEVRERIELVHGDMRNFKLDKKFNLVMIPYRAFGYMYTVEDQLQALANVREHLVDEGKLIFNMFDPNLRIIADRMGSLGSAQTLIDEFIHPDTGLLVTVWDTRRYELEDQFVEQYFIFEEVNREGKMVSRQYVPLKLRYFYRFELQHLLERCGYRIEALYGDFNRAPFQSGREQIWVASKGA
jgi:ubiquinone/menaquinone biosynthesis C-methylase UbiE